MFRGRTPLTTPELILLTRHLLNAKQLLGLNNCLRAQIETHGRNTMQRQMRALMDAERERAHKRAGELERAERANEERRMQEKILGRSRLLMMLELEYARECELQRLERERVELRNLKRIAELNMRLTELGVPIAFYSQDIHDMNEQDGRE